MLNMLRQSAGSWLAKGLFGLLILSFGIWGIGDVVRGGGGKDVAVAVGEVEIAPYTVRQQFDRKVNQMRQMLGDQMTVEFARQMGLMDATIREIIGSATMDMAARDLGITISDQAIRDEIAATPAFQSQQGVFSAQQFQTLLAQNGYTESRYVSELRQDLLRARLAQVLAGGVSAPAELSSALYRYTQEQRSAESLTVHADTLTVTQTPTDDELQAIYKDASANYMAPEYRTIVGVLLPQEAAAKRVTVSDQDIADHYQANRDTYTSAEKRTLTQVIVPTQEAAAAVAAAIAAGTPIAQAAADNGSTPMIMGAVAHKDLLPAIADSVFALTAGQVSEPLQSPLGWHVFEVGSVIAPQLQELDTVKDSIAESLRNERAVDQLYAESAELEDMLGGGATVEEAAEKMNLPLVTLTMVDADGKDQDGKAVSGLPAGDAGSKILETGFANELNEDSRLQTYNGGYLITRTDAIQAPAPRALDTVRDELVAQWTANQQAEMAQKLAAELASKAEQGATLESLQAAPTVTYSKHSPVTRDGNVASDADKTLPTLISSMVARLFALPQNGIATAKSAEGQQVVRLLSITQANPQDNPAALAALRQGLGQAIGDDMLVEATNALGNRFGVKVNQAAIDSTF